MTPQFLACRQLSKSADRFALSTEPMSRVPDESHRPNLLNVEFIEFPQWTGNSRPPGARTFFDNSSKNWVCLAEKKNGNVRDFLGDHFATVESSGNPNLTMFILDCFNVFSSVHIGGSGAHPACPGGSELRLESGQIANCKTNCTLEFQIA